ncbi:MAG: hypothetical protein ABSC61_02600 [Anaerolineales bacterium]
MRDTNRKLILDLFLLCLVVLFSVLVHYEGWRSATLNNPDIMPYYLGAVTQLQTGNILDRGNLSFYNSFVPPGAVYWILLGASFMPDLRLYALPANILLTLGSVIFLYLLVRDILGRETALVSGLVYGFSRLGYQTVWPIGHSIYLILILFFTNYWIRHRKPWAFFAIAIVSAFGAYDYLSILPCLFIPLIAWLLFRPPIRILPVVASLAAGLLIWFPYLQFEVPRHFIDLQSILLLSRVSNKLTLEPKGDPKSCLATLPSEPDVRDGVYVPWIDNTEYNRLVFPESGVKSSLYYHLCIMFLNMDNNFDEGYVRDGNLNADFVYKQNSYLDGGEGLFINSSPAIGVICWLFFMTGLFQSAAMFLPEKWIQWNRLSQWRSIPVWIITCIALVVSGAVFLFVAWLLRYPWIEKSHYFQLIATQANYFMPLILFAIIIGFYLGLQAPRQEPGSVFSLFSLWIPWSLLVIIAEPGVPERFYWIWPLQVAVAVMALHGYLRAWTDYHWVRWIVSVAAIVVVFPLSAYLPRIQNAITYGYAGQDSEQIQVVDFIGQKVRNAGLTRVSIGYLFPTENPFTVAKDPALWGGTWVNLLLQTRWKVENTDFNPEGISLQDRWRIWIPAVPACRQEDAKILGWENYLIVFQSGPYCVFELEEGP